jgi:hypothetical protein
VGRQSHGRTRRAGGGHRREVERESSRDKRVKTGPRPPFVRVAHQRPHRRWEAAWRSDRSRGRLNHRAAANFRCVPRRAHRSHRLLVAKTLRRGCLCVPRYRRLVVRTYQRGLSASGQGRWSPLREAARSRRVVLFSGALLNCDVTRVPPPVTGMAPQAVPVGARVTAAVARPVSDGAPCAGLLLHPARWRSWVVS